MLILRLDSTDQHRWLPYIYLLVLAGLIIVCAWAETNRQRKLDRLPATGRCLCARIPRYQCGRVPEYTGVDTWSVTYPLPFKKRLHRYAIHGFLPAQPTGSRTLDWRLHWGENRPVHILSTTPQSSTGAIRRVYSGKADLQRDRVAIPALLATALPAYRKGEPISLLPPTLPSVSALTRCSTSLEQPGTFRCNV